MVNATLKFALIVALALGVVYIMRSAEKFTPYDESMTNRFEHNAPYEPVIKPAKKSHALLRAAVPTNQPKGTGVDPNLLPKPAADDGFGQFAPDPSQLAGQNFVDASRWVSLGAMSSRRNMTRDLRADIPIPKTNAVSPWNQSSIEQQVPGKALDCP